MLCIQSVHLTQFFSFALLASSYITNFDVVISQLPVKENIPVQMLCVQSVHRIY